jgi:hypothetical protein
MTGKKRQLFIYTSILLLIGIVLASYFRGDGVVPFVGIEKDEIPWSIGIYTGKSPLSLRAPTGVTEPVLTASNITDEKAEFVADPFLVQDHGVWYLFFEVMDAVTGQGDIGLASSTDALSWTYRQIVLDEPFHLSFPYVFEWEGAHYMVPESSEANAIRLYKADPFPTRWSFVEQLIEGSYVDTSLCRYHNKWWLFTTRPHPNSDSVYLYYADSLLGPWIKHPKNPVVEDALHSARSGGRVVMFDGRLIRYAQDVYPVYGKEVRAFEITALSETEYKEEQIGARPIIGATGHGWNGRGMHTVDPHEVGDGTWIAAVDGNGETKRVVFGLAK